MLMSWPAVEPSGAAPELLEVLEDEDEVEELPELVPTADESLNRLVVPRIAPRLDVEEAVPESAALELVEVVLLVSLLLESELEEVDDDEEVDEEVVVLEPEEDALELEVEAVLPLDVPPPAIAPPVAAALLLRPPPRLPRNCGTISAANRSAPTVPAIRTERSSPPEYTAAVRTVSSVERVACLRSADADHR